MCAAAAAGNRSEARTARVRAIRLVTVSLLFRFTLPRGIAVLPGRFMVPQGYTRAGLKVIAHRTARSAAPASATIAFASRRNPRIHRCAGVSRESCCDDFLRGVAGAFFSGEACLHPSRRHLVLRSVEDPCDGSRELACGQPGGV